MKLFYVACFLATSHLSFSQEINFDIGMNKVGYSPFYRTFSEKYEPSFQTDFSWRIVGLNQSRHQLLMGIWLQWNLQQVVGNQLNVGPLLKYRLQFSSSFFTEIQSGYGFQLLFPTRKLYEQTQNGDWQPASQILANHIVPFQIGIGKRFDRHAIQLNYGYQLIFGFNPSINTLPSERWSLAYCYQIKSMQ